MICIRFIVVLVVVYGVRPSVAFAHGIWNHIHVTGWAIENLPDSEWELQAFFSDPEVVNAALFGAAFADSGYFPQGGDLAARSRAYSEHSHWAPFVEDFIRLIISESPPPWSEQEEKKRVAFLMGVASHGLQDELFDSLFLYQIEEHDHHGQDHADPASDGFLSLDDHIRFHPVPYIPMATLLTLYQGLEPAVDEQTIVDSVALMTGLYVNDTVGLDVVSILGDQYTADLPWMRQHYLDADIPASIRSEIYPTMFYLIAIWDRLHNYFDADQAIISTFPEYPRRLRSHDAELPDSWVSVVFGAGVRYESTSPQWIDNQEVEVPFERANNRWGGEYTRIIRLMPTADLLPGGWYDLQLDAGFQTIDGSQSQFPFVFSLQVECLDSNDTDCPELGDIPVASIEEQVEPEEEAPTGTVSAEEGKSAPKADGCSTVQSRVVPIGESMLVLVLIGWACRSRKRLII